MSAIYGCCCCRTNTLIYRFNDEACWQTGNAWLLRLQLAGLRARAVFASSGGNATQWRATVVFPPPRHMSTCSEWGDQQTVCWGEGLWGSWSDWFAATATAFKLSCKQHAAILPLLAVAGLFHSFTRPASCSTSFPTASSPSSSPSPSTLDQCDNNATSAVAFASARQTRCASRPAGALQSAYPATHTHTLTHMDRLQKCACAAYANVLTKHARPSICQVGKESSAHFLVDTFQLTSLA